MKVRYKSLSFLGLPKYRVGNDGSVWSSCYGGWRERIQKKKGSNILILCHDGKRYCWDVSHLVLLAFVGPRPKGMVACHSPDNDRTNNRLSNLRWGTPKENQQDRLAHGTSNHGERNCASKLTETDVRIIRREYNTGMSQAKLAEQFGISRAAVGYIVRRRSWAHI